MAADPDYWRNLESSSPHYWTTYAKYDICIEEKLFRPIINLTDTPKSFLEIGCNCGKHLHYLYNALDKPILFGIEISEGAVHGFETTFPDTYHACQITIGDANFAIHQIENDKCDCVFTINTLMAIQISKRFDALLTKIYNISKKYIFCSERHMNRYMKVWNKLGVKVLYHQKNRQPEQILLEKS